MMKKILLLLLFLLIGTLTNAQLAINTALTPTQMVQNFVGSGVTVSNIVYTGGANSKGFFSNGSTTNLGLNSGIVLCTGTATQIPNPATFFMSTNLNLAGDANLNSINNGCLTHDACILEFDFIPTSDTVKFKYVFGSEEYPNYVCSQYQDVFAFFVTGANPSGGNYTNYNMALIPGTTIPVSVNSVNSGTPGGSYSAGGCMSLSYSNYYVNNSAIGGTTIAFGGFTTPLTAWCHVTPCQTYHLKMAVGDGFNGLFDSGVFLEANSFTSNGLNVNTSYSNSSLGSNAIEGCTNGIISFTTNTPVATPMMINYTVSGNATNGVDYTAIPNSITIPAGQDSVALIIHPLLDGITEGTETVIITVTTGCTSQTYTLNIIDNVNLSVNVGAGSTICSGNSANLSATANGGIGPFTYNWNPGGGTGSPVAVSPTVTTTYIVTVSDYCASSATNNVTITVNPIPTIITTATPAATCVGQSTALTCSGAATYIWMPGSLSGTPVNVSPTSTTTYSVTGTSASGCTSTSSVTVTVNPSPIVTATALPASLCLGQSTVLTGAGANTYSWMPGSLSGTTVYVTPATTTTYSVTGTSVAGCTSTGSVTVTINSNASIAVTALPATICLGQSTVLTGAGANTYSWMPGSLSGTTINVTPATTTTYSVTGTTSTGCSGTTSLTVSVNPIPIITASALPANICNGQSTSLTGAGANTYSWMPGSLSGTTVNVTPAATMTYSVTGTSAAGCTSTGSVTVTINSNASITVTALPTNICNGQTSIITGSGANTYSWMPGSLIGTTINVTPATTTTYSVTGTTSTGCTGTTSLTVTVNQNPTLSISALPTAICNGQSTSLTGAGAFTYSWMPGSLSGTTVNVIPTTTTSYSATGTSAAGCTSTSSITVTVNPNPTTFPSSQNEHCLHSCDGSALVNTTGGNPGYTYSWNTNPVQDSMVAINLCAGNYIVTVTDANGCTKTESASVTTNALIEAAVNPSAIMGVIPFNVDFTFTGYGSSNYFWNFGDGSPIATSQNVSHVYPNSGQYEVTLVINSGAPDFCADSVKTLITVESPSNLIVPNIFTPNGDGKNDFFNAKSEGLESLKVKVYNRWGSLMAEWNTIDAGWDGKNKNGADAADGAYFYILTAKGKDGVVYNDHGSVTLIR
jgi:gliding motility-associated-like protein